MISLLPRVVSTGFGTALPRGSGSVRRTHARQGSSRCSQTETLRERAALPALHPRLGELFQEFVLVRCYATLPSQEPCTGVPPQCCRSLMALSRAHAPHVIQKYIWRPCMSQSCIRWPGAIARRTRGAPLHPVSSSWRGSIDEGRIRRHLRHRHVPASGCQSCHAKVRTRRRRLCKLCIGSRSQRVF